MSKPTMQARPPRSQLASPRCGRDAHSERVQGMQSECCPDRPASCAAVLIEFKQKVSVVHDPVRTPTHLSNTNMPFSLYSLPLCRKASIGTRCGHLAFRRDCGLMIGTYCSCAEYFSLQTDRIKHLSSILTSIAWSVPSQHSIFMPQPSQVTYSPGILSQSAA